MSEAETLGGSNKLVSDAAPLGLGYALDESAQASSSEVVDHPPACQCRLNITPECRCRSSEYSSRLPLPGALAMIAELRFHFPLWKGEQQ